MLEMKSCFVHFLNLDKETFTHLLSLHSVAWIWATLTYIGLENIKENISFLKLFKMNKNNNEM